MRIIFVFLFLMSLGCVLAAPAPFPKPIKKNLYGKWNILWGDSYRGTITFKSNGNYEFDLKTTTLQPVPLQGIGRYKLDAEWNLTLMEWDSNNGKEVKYDLTKQEVTRSRIIWRTLKGDGVIIEITK